MRTTLTLDEDVALLLRKELRRSGEPLKQTVNRCLRAALAPSGGRAKAKPFRVTPINMKLPQGINLDKTSFILEALEGPLYR